MGAPARGTSDALLTEINVTPLVDVVLVLLILMMVTATTLASKTIPVELPKAKTGESEANAKPLVVTVDENGRAWFEREAADDEAVRLRARAAVARDANAPAVLAADGRARHEAVVRVLEILRSERVAKIAIVVRAEPAR
ncbi:MAG: biopolymer transporter ExbD [Deltaproteobacteria bacterium]|nr:biopolymer transporter ExbD [Deltaproteobacteria bacterium]